MIPSAGIKRMHVVSSQLAGGPRRRIKNYTFNLLAETADGGRTKIAGGFTREDADNAKQAIERTLLIQPAKPPLPDKKAVDRPVIDSFYSGRTPAQPSASGAGQHKARADTTTLRGVIGIWAFVLLWNGFVWWVIWLMISGRGTAITPFVVVFLSLFVLVGLGLIYLLMPWTVKFFRERGMRVPTTAPAKGGWTVLLSLAGIVVGFVLIFAMQGTPRQDAVSAGAPYSPEEHFRGIQGDVMMSIERHAGPPQPLAFFEGAWRRHGLVEGRGKFTRVVMRSEADGHRIRAWYICDVAEQQHLGVCDAGEVPAVIGLRPDGLVDHVSAGWNVAAGRMWLRLGSGKDPQQPAIMGSVAFGPFGMSPDYIDGQTFTLHENPAIPLAAFVGEWSSLSAGQAETRSKMHFTRLTLRQTGPHTLAMRLWAICVSGSECDRGEMPVQIEWEEGLVRELRANFSREAQTFWGLSVVLLPPHQGRFNAVTVRPGTKTTVGKAQLAGLASGHR